MINEANKLHLGESVPCLNQNLRPGVMVECRSCGAAVALVENRAGRKYTAEVTGEIRPRWRPGYPHFKVCGKDAS